MTSAHPRVGIAASQPGKGRVSFKKQEGAEHQRDPGASADVGDPSRRIGQRLEPEDLAIGDQRSQRELPSPRPGQVEGGDRIDRREIDAERERGDEHAYDDEGDQPPFELEQRKQQNRPDEIELLFDAERPEVQKRLHRRVGPEIAPDACEPHQPEIHREVRIAEQAAADVAKLRRRGHEPSDDPDEAHRYEKRRQDAFGAAGVEHRERETSGRALAENDARNEKTRDDEENVDAGESAWQPGAIGVEDHHAKHRERAQSIDVVSEIELGRSSRRDEVGRFEGFVQQRVLPAAGKARPFAARG